jgi:hypothetical protein
MNGVGRTLRFGPLALHLFPTPRAWSTMCQSRRSRRATLLMAPAVLLLLLLVNDREIMGAQANGLPGNLVGGTIVVGIVLVGAFYAVITVFPGLGQ